VFSQNPFRLIDTYFTYSLGVQIEVHCVDPGSIVLAAGAAIAFSHDDGSDPQLAIDGSLDDQQGWACGKCGEGAAIFFAFESPSMVQRCELMLFEIPSSRLGCRTQEVCCKVHFRV
jgi:hypothetical protein